ncbi:MAG: hypothetical protein EZS28_050298, partial [Streblomastix strix]
MYNKHQIVMIGYISDLQRIDADPNFSLVATFEPKHRTLMTHPPQQVVHLMNYEFVTLSQPLSKDECNPPP